jgi:hypothetical protein
MTGMVMFEKAMEMLGYSSADGISGKADLLKKGLTVINNIYAELYYAWQDASVKPFSPLKSINEEIDLPPLVLDTIMPYGVAMYLAQSEGDADNQNLYSMIYNQKKTKVKSISAKHKLPYIWE